MINTAFFPNYDYYCIKQELTLRLTLRNAFNSYM